MRGALGLERHPALLRAWQTTATFALVGVAWVFFRAASLGDAWYVLTHFGAGLPAQLRTLATLDHAAIRSLVFLDFEPSRLAIAMAAVVALLVVEHVQATGVLSLRERVSQASAPLRWAAYSAAVLTIMTLGVFHSARFIYFQF
jgi:hypothetical protein